MYVTDICANFFDGYAKARSTIYLMLILPDGIAVDQPYVAADYSG